MTERGLIVLVAVFVVMMTIVAMGIAVALHRRKRAHAQEARRGKHLPSRKPLPTAGERLRQD